MRQILRKKVTTAAIAGALVVGVGALAGVATAGGSDSPAPASRPSTDDTADNTVVDNTVGTVPSSQVTTPTGGVTTPTLDDHGGDRDDSDDDNSGHRSGDDDDSDDSSGHGGDDDDRSGSNSGPG